MNVAFVSSTYRPVVGGAERYAATLVDTLRRRGHRVVVLTDGTRVAAAPREEDVHRLDLNAQELAREDRVFWQQLYFGLAREIENAVGDIVFDLVHANGLEAAIVGSLLALQRGIPLLATFHEQSPEMESLGRGRCELVYRHVPIHTTIGGSSFYVRRAVEFGAARTKLIYHGVDQMVDVPGHALGAPPRLLCLARLKARKGLLELIGAVAILRDLGDIVHLRICGSVSSASVEYAAQLLSQITELDLDSQVEIDTSVTLDRVQNELSNCDVYVQPSFEEGLGLSVLEALAAARPCVVTNIPAFREFCVDGVNTLIVEPGDPRQLAETIRRLMRSEDLRQRLGCQGHEDVAERFTSDRMVDDTEVLYEEVIRTP